MNKFKLSIILISFCIGIRAQDNDTIPTTKNNTLHSLGFSLGTPSFGLTHRIQKNKFKFQWAILPLYANKNDYFINVGILQGYDFKQNKKNAFFVYNKQGIMFLDLFGPTALSYYGVGIGVDYTLGNILSSFMFGQSIYLESSTFSTIFFPNAGVSLMYNF